MGQILSGYSKKAYTILGALGFVALIDTSMISPIIAAQARALNSDAFTAGLIAGVYSLVAIPMIVFSGFLSDIYGRRRIVMVGLVGDLIVMILYTLAPTPLILLSVRILHAVFDSFIVPPILALIGDVFSKSVGGPLSFFWMFMAAAILLGSGSATGLVLTLGFQAVYAVIGALVTACIVLTAKGLPFTAGHGSKARGRTRLIKGYMGRVAISMLGILSMYLLVGGVIGTLPTILIDRFGLDEKAAAAQIGLFMALSTAASIPIFPLSARMAERKTPAIPLLIGLSASTATALILELGAGSTPLRALSAIAFGLALGSIILSSSYLVVTLPAEVRGLGSGLNQSASLLGVALGAPLTSLYVATLGETGVFLFCGAILPLVTVALIMSAERKKGLKTWT